MSSLSKYNIDPISQSQKVKMGVDETIYSEVWPLSKPHQVDFW